MLKFSLRQRCAKAATTFTLTLAVLLAGGVQAAAAEAKASADTEEPRLGKYTLGVKGLNKKIYSELVKRWGRSDAPNVRFYTPDKKSGGKHGDAESLADNEGDNYQWEVFVPESYDGSVPHGIIAYINSGDGGILFNSWKEVLEERNLIWVCGLKAGNEVDPLFRHAMVLEGVNQIRKRYNVDNDRTYVAGLSGGGRAAGILMLMFADVFDGGWTICGVNPIGKASAKQMQTAKTKNRYVFMTGDDDYNREQVKQVYDQYKGQGFARAKYIQVTGMDHANPDEPGWVRQAIEFLDAPLTAAAEKRFTKAKSSYKKNRFAKALVGFEKAVAHGGDADFVEEARELVGELRKRYREDYLLVNDLVETADLKIAQKRLTSFRKRWVGIADDDVAELTARLKRYRSEGRPEPEDIPAEELADKSHLEEKGDVAKDGANGSGADSGGAKKIADEKSDIPMPSDKPWDNTKFPQHPFKFTLPEGLAGFTIGQGHQVIPQGLHFFPGAETIATSKQEYKYPAQIFVMVGAAPPAVRDVVIKFADVEFSWGEENNTKTVLTIGGERKEIAHLPIPPQQLVTVAITVFDDRTLLIKLAEQQVYRDKVPEGVGLAGPLVLSGTGNIIHHGLVIHAEKRNGTSDSGDKDSDDDDSP